jgi:dienelactone hydrolase
MAVLTDRTGRPGPATWEVSDYPAGQADFPVGGVSWYEAKAYARFAGKQLPTIYHWVWAATIDRAHLIIPQSNFEPRGPAPVGRFRGMTGFGALDMAGNVREWCENATGGDRFALGGAWGEPQHMFNANHHQDPFDRSAANGFRLARFSTSDSAAAGPVEVQVRDFSVERPASDEAFAIYRRAYDYDPAPLDARIEHTDTTADWVRERVSFSAGYGGERMIAVLFLPRTGRPPYQTLVSFPGAYALIGTITRDGYTDFFASYVTKSGRAFMLPMYKGTYERSDTMSKTAPNESSYYRDRIIQMGKDLRRSVDYLATRRDIDSSRIAYFGTSWGGAIGGILIAIEPRFRTAVMVSGGLFFERSQPEVDPLNFLPHVRMPVLMINGRYDSIFPVEASQDPMFRMLGTPRDRKQHIIEESPHAPPAEVLFTKAFAWLDRYLGPTP